MQGRYAHMSKEELLALLAEQQATIDKQGTALEEKETKIERLNNELQDLKRLYFGRKSERYVSGKPGDPSQLSLIRPTSTRGYGGANG